MFGRRRGPVAPVRAVAIGLDPAKLSEFTGLVIAEITERPTGRTVHSRYWHDQHGPPGFAKGAPAVEGCYEEAEDLFVIGSFGRLQSLPTPT
jgi:hypothetical protein